MLENGMLKKEFSFDRPGFQNFTKISSLIPQRIEYLFV